MAGEGHLFNHINKIRKMEQRIIRLLTATALISGVLLLNSCKKEVQKKPKEIFDTNSFVNVNDAYSDALAIIDDANGNVYKNSLNSVVSSCAVKTNDTVSSPHVYTLDFGTGCLGNDGIRRSGKIIVHYNYFDLKQSGSDILVSFDNFFVAAKRFEGSLHLHNNGININGNANTDFVTNLIVTNTVTGAVQSGDINANIEWLAGYDTNGKDDDQISITGSVNVSKNGNVYHAYSTSPIIRYFAPGCNYYVQGTLFIQQAGQPDRSADFGSGVCDNEVYVTENGQTTTYYMD